MRQRSEAEPQSFTPKVQQRKAFSVVLPATPPHEWRTRAKQKKTPKVNPDTKTSGQVSGLTKPAVRHRRISFHGGLSMGAPKQASGLNSVSSPLRPFDSAHFDRLSASKLSASRAGNPASAEGGFHSTPG